MAGVVRSSIPGINGSFVIYDFTGVLAIKSVKGKDWLLKGYNFSRVTTIGDRSFISLAVSDDIPAEIILDILYKFDKYHPEWEMGNWFLEKNKGILAGIYINHKPKEANNGNF
jgi:hypothetical protein